MIENRTDIDNLIARSLNGDASAKEILKVDKMLSADFTPDDIDLDEARSRLRNSIRKRSLDRFVSVMNKAAAILILPLVCLTLYLGLKPSESGRISEQTIRSPYGTVSSLTLPDGTDVWLNGGSSITFPSRFKGKVREVRVEGETYFEVTSDKKHPFIVKSKDLQVTATGTKFNVRQYAGEDEACVTLISGRVCVRTDNDDRDLSPGDALHFDTYERSGKIIPGSSGDYKWKDGIASFENASLGHVLQRLGITYNISFEFADKELASYMFHGTFENESLEQILKVISKTIPIGFEDSGYITKNGAKTKRITVYLETV